MDLHKAWSLLGRDSERIIHTIKALPRDQRAEAAKKILEKAKKMAKELSSKHHPDVGGDPEKFKLIWEAVRIIETHTKEFELRLKELENKPVSKKTTIDFG